MQEVLDDLQSRLAAYFGMLNLREAKLPVAPEDQVSKPDDLIKYEQMQELGIPVWAGGIQDQPHIWLMELGIIRNMLLFHEAEVRARAKPKEGQHGL